MIGKTNRVEFVDDSLMVNSVKCFSQVQKNRTCDRSLVHIIQYSIEKNLSQTKEVHATSILVALAMNWHHAEMKCFISGILRTGSASI